MSTTKNKLVPKDVSEDMRRLIEDIRKDDSLFGESKKFFESINTLYLFNEHSEFVYSDFASKFLIMSFIFEYSHKLNSYISKKHKIEPTHISIVYTRDASKKYGKYKNKELEKDPVISWFFEEGLSVFEEAVNKKEYKKLNDFTKISIHLDLLKEYLTKIEDESDFYEILSQFEKAFETYPTHSSKHVTRVCEMYDHGGGITQDYSTSQMIKIPYE